MSIECDSDDSSYTVAFAVVFIHLVSRLEAAGCQRPTCISAKCRLQQSVAAMQYWSPAMDWSRTRVFFRTWARTQWTQTQCYVTLKHGWK